MGIGRRDFLKFATLALGSLALQRSGLVSINGDYYVNDRVGLGFIKPSGWQFDALRDFAPIVEGQSFRTVAPEDYDEFMRDQISNLVVTISRYPHDEDRFGPAITIFKGVDEESPKRTLPLLVDDSIRNFADILLDYRIIEPPAPLDISRCQAMRFRAGFQFEHRRLAEPVLVEDETLVIDQGSSLYSIHLYSSPAIHETAPREFQRFVESIHLA